MGFDVDCSSVAFDGSQVWATSRALAALMTRTNRIDLTRRSPSYEKRLAKFAKRGFQVLCPDLDRTLIDQKIIDRPYRQLEGLARLLALEKVEADPPAGGSDVETYEAPTSQSIYIPYGPGFSATKVGLPVIYLAYVMLKRHSSSKRFKRLAMAARELVHTTIDVLPVALPR